MLSLDDCIALSELTEDEIAAIAEHEHIPFAVALELGDYLCRTPAGVLAVRAMIEDDILAARDRGDLREVLTLKLALRHFVESHPLADGPGGTVVSIGRGPC